VDKEVILMGLRPDNGGVIIQQPQQLERRVARLERENQRQEREINQLQRDVNRLERRLQRLEDNCCEED
jgi:predicted RNase H-like nuclease (RuvC/YqgF family)